MSPVLKQQPHLQGQKEENKNLPNKNKQRPRNKKYKVYVTKV